MMRLVPLNSAREFEKALRQARHADGLVIDLRGNGGGLLQAAIDIGSMFIAQGIIVQTVDREGRTEQIPSTGRVLALSLLDHSAEPLAVEQDQPGAIAADAQRIYWTTASAISSLDVSGDEDVPAVEALAEQLPAPSCLTAAGGYLYWTSAEHGTVARVPKPGGAVEVIATAQDQPLNWAVPRLARF